MSFFQKHRGFLKILLIVLALYFSLVGFWTGFVTKSRIQSNIKTRTGLNVEMGLFYFYPFTGNGYVKNIRIPNPGGFFSKNAVNIDEIRFRGGRKTLYGEDAMQVEEIQVHGVQIHFEPKGDTTNFHKLYQQGSGYYDGSDTEQKWFKRVYIERLEMDPIQIVLGHKLLNKTISFDPVVIENIGTPEEGVGLFGFGRVLLDQYRPVIQKAMADPQSPLPGEIRNNVLKWLELKKVR